LLVLFAERVRARKQSIDTFVVDFFGGIMMNRLALSSPEPPKKKTRRGRRKGTTSTSKNCHLPLLDVGMETGMALKKLIAEFAGIPLGHDYKLLLNAEKHLELFGY